MSDRVIFRLKGTPNIGIPEERTEDVAVNVYPQSIAIRTSDENTIVSFNPFSSGGSLWISHMSELILDTEPFEVGKNVGTIKTSTNEILEWKEKAEAFDKLKQGFQSLWRGE